MHLTACTKRTKDTQPKNVFSIQLSIINFYQIHLIWDLKIMGLEKVIQLTTVEIATTRLEGE